MDSIVIAGQVRELVERRLEIASHRLRPTTRFVDDLGVDSLALVDLTLALEEEFDIDVADDDVARLCTLQDAVDYVERCLRAKGPSGDRPS